MVTLHAADELEEDGFSVLDLERGILTGSILEVQRDRRTWERKYRIRGTTRFSEAMERQARHHHRLQALRPIDMRCDNCGREGARERRVTRTYGEDAELLVIEHVPIITCPSCGESYMTAATLHHLEDLRDRGRSVAVPRPVGVVQFETA